MNLISKDLFEKIQAAGCVWYWDKLDVTPHVNAPQCDDYFNQWNDMLNCVNIYDLYRTNYEFQCAPNSTVTATKERVASVEIDGFTHTYKRGHTLAERIPWMRAFFRENHPAINTIVGDGQSDYLNRKDVRLALNIPSYLPAYQQCNDQIYNTYKSFREGSVWIYPTLKSYGYRLMHYSGDTDGAVPTLGTRKWIAQQGWSVTKDWRAWTTDDQISGNIIEYDNFVFATMATRGGKKKQKESMINFF